MERIATDIHQQVGQLLTLQQQLFAARSSRQHSRHGASLSLASSTDSTGVSHQHRQATTSAGNSAVNYHQARRLLRRLDRSLQALEEQLEQKYLPLPQQPQDSQDDSTENRSRVLEDTSETVISLTVDLKELLLHLQLDTARLDNAVQDLTVSTLCKASNAFLTLHTQPVIAEDVCNVLSLTDCWMLVHRIARYPVPAQPLVPVVNHYWIAGSGQNSSDADNTTMIAAEEIYQSVWILHSILPRALETLEAPWEAQDVTTTEQGNSAAEARVQLRVLTSFVLQQVARQSSMGIPTQDSELDAGSTSNGTNAGQSSVHAAWMQEQVQRILQESGAAPVTLQAVQHALKQVYNDIRVYITELVNYAVDAIDGASVLVEEQQHMQQSQQSDNNSACDTLTPLVCLVLDCVRHVTLATNALVAVEPWGMVDCFPLYTTLWKTTATAFLLTESTGDPVRLPPVFDERFCHTLLRLADLSLKSLAEAKYSNPSAVAPQVSSLPLATTFLRVVKHPALYQSMLLPPEQHSEEDSEDSAEHFWSTIEDEILHQGHVEMKQVVQAALLSLANTRNDKDGMDLRLVVHALMNRLLPTFVNSSSDPWDRLFFRHWSLVASKGEAMAVEE